MNRALLLAALLVACGGEPAAPAPEPEPEPVPEPEAPRTEVPTEPPSTTPSWLNELLAFDLRAVPTDRRVIALADRLGAPSVCPQPGTGCYVELELGGYTTQVHMGDDQAMQVWGPTENERMAGWINRVEAEIDRSDLLRVNEVGARPDRLWMDPRHAVLLHDHTDRPCGGFCPAMIWIAPPDHPNAAGYGFPPVGR